jgi:UDP-3-O-[3-hydroxymyristoyl] glucosamine N-acyltransferase
MQMTLEQIAALTGGHLQGNPQCTIVGAGPIDAAGEGQITFAEKGPALKKIDQSRATAIIAPRNAACAGRNLVCVDQPRLAFAKVVAVLYPPSHPPAGVHPAAVIGENCVLGKGISVSACAVLGRNVIVGDRVVLYPHVFLGDETVIGDDSVIYPHVSILERCRIGCRVTIHAGTVIGSDGYGFVQDRGRHVKMPQTGIVQIDDDVEIGANNTIDRATFGRTLIKCGVKTDNQVHIAHNVEVGEHSLLVAQVGISGSTKIGRNVIIAGQAGLAGHLSVGDGAIIGPQAGIGHDVPDKQILSGGIVAMPHRTWLRLQKVLPELPELLQRIRQLEAGLRNLQDPSQ